MPLSTVASAISGVLPPNPFLMGKAIFDKPIFEKPEGQKSRERIEHGEHTIKQEVFSFVDKERSTPAYASYGELDERRLGGKIYRPVRIDRPSPLIVYSHGFMSNSDESLYLLKFLASHGYTVVSIDFPLTGLRPTRLKTHAPDVVNQPGDVSAVIDYMLQRNDDRADSLHNSIDVDKIGLTGLSMGAMTSMLTTFHPELRDTRVAASTFIAGPTTMFTKKFFRSTDVPSLLIYADTDSLVEHDQHAEAAHQYIPASALVTVKNGSHAGFSQQAAGHLRFFKNPDKISCMLVKMGLNNNMLERFHYEEVLGGKKFGMQAPAFDPGQFADVLTPVAMKPTRQHTLTTLATHAFFESQFARRKAQREASRRYLHNIFPMENKGEIEISSTLQ